MRASLRRLGLQRVVQPSVVPALQPPWHRALVVRSVALDLNVVFGGATQ